MYLGEVLWYDPALGVGLIQQPGGPDLWVFAESLAGARGLLAPGERVRFQVVFGPWGPQATWVVSVDHEDPCPAEASPPE